MLGNLLGGKILVIGRSKVKIEIYNLIVDRKEISIKEIHKLIKSSEGKIYNYRTIWQHLKSLEQIGLISLAKNEHSAGQPVTAKILDLTLNEIK